MIVKFFAVQILVPEVLAHGEVDSFFPLLLLLQVFSVGQFLCSPLQSSGVSQGLASRLATKGWEHGESHMPKTGWIQIMF